MKHTLRIKWLAACLAALSFAGSADAVTNALNAAHMATLERDIGLINTGKTVNVSRLLSEAWRMISALEKSGDRSLLPYFAEKSMDAANPETVRSRAAAAYANLATAEECIGFLPKILALNDDKGHWRYGVTSKLLSKIDAAVAAREISEEALNRLLSALVSYTQSTAFSTEAEWVDNFLVNHCDGYPTSEQRLFLWTRIVKGGNKLEKEHFLPVKETIEAVPPRKRVDLRKRFPNLPPLPEDKNAGPSLKIVLAIGAAFVAVCVAIWIRVKRRKTPTREKE
ncbi:MAG: hypothetical protein WCP12_18245 [bacterium]